MMWINETVAGSKASGYTVVMKKLRSGLDDDPHSQNSLEPHT
jgi:hypothetical protein